MKHPRISFVLSWLDGEIERGPKADSGHAFEIRNAILEHDDGISTPALQWLERMASGRKWREQANACFDIIDCNRDTIECVPYWAEQESA
jgi:hypothetical protein